MLVVLLVAGVAFWLESARGSSEGPWLPGHARQATAEAGGGLVVVRDVRNFRHTAGKEAIESWEDREFDLSSLDSVWLGVSDIPGPKALAHLFLSFGFADGRYLVVSDLELEQARARYWVSGRSGRFGEDPAYSARIRDFGDGM